MFFDIQGSPPLDVFYAAMARRCFSFAMVRMLTIDQKMLPIETDRFLSPVFSIGSISVKTGGQLRFSA